MTYAEALRKFKLEYWAALMDECGGRVPAVAKIAGIDRTSVYKALRKVGIQVRQAHKGNWGDLA